MTAHDAPRPETDDDLREEPTDSETIHEGHYLSFRIDHVRTPDGRRARREIVGHPGAVAIAALDEDGLLLMVRQWRHAAGRALLEIPAGTLDRRDDGSIEDPDLAAPRELEEETGYRARSWRKLGEFWTAPGFATELMRLYLATELTPAHEDRLGPDDDERLVLERHSVAEALALIEAGGIGDAKTIVGVLWVARILGERPRATG